MIPGGDLLAQALTKVAPQPFQYQANTGRTLNGIGIWEADYAPVVTLLGSIQAVNRKVYQEYGLDFQKNYTSFFVSADVLDLARDFSGDRIIYRGRLFQVVSKTDWYPIDGWVRLIACDVGPWNPPAPVLAINPIGVDDVVAFEDAGAVDITGTATDADGATVAVAIDGNALGSAVVASGAWALIGADLTPYADGNSHTVTADTAGAVQASRPVVVEAAGPIWDPDFQAWIDGISGRGGQLPAPEEYPVLNQGFVDLKTIGIWQKADAIQLRFMPTRDCALADWRVPSRVAVVSEFYGSVADFVPYIGFEVVNPGFQEYQTNVTGFVGLDTQYSPGEAPGNYSALSSCVMTKTVGFGTGLFSGPNWAHRTEGAWALSFSPSLTANQADAYYNLDNPGASYVDFGIDTANSAQPFADVFGALDPSVLDLHLFRQREGDAASVSTVDSVLSTWTNAQTAIPAGANFNGWFAANTPFFRDEVFFAGAALTDPEKADLVAWLANLQAALQVAPE